MKKFSMILKQTALSLLALMIGTIAMSQSFVEYERGFNFQGYAIDSEGKSVAGQAVTVKITLTSPSTTEDFVEEHSTSTDAFGVFSIEIGAVENTKFKKLDFTRKAANFSMTVAVKKGTAGYVTIITGQPLKAVPYARQAANGVPVGTIIAFAGNATSVPPGWLICDGSSVLQTAYPQLYAVIGSAWGTSGSNFNLPDLRGRFMRGVDDPDGSGGNATAGNDPSVEARTASAPGGNVKNAVGSKQEDDTKSHLHTATQPAHTHFYQDIYWMESHPGSVDVGDDGVGNEGANGEADGDNGGYQWGRTTGSANPAITIGSTGGSETRPKNVGVNYIIKY